MIFIYLFGGRGHSKKKSYTSRMFLISCKQSATYEAHGFKGVGRYEAWVTKTKSINMNMSQCAVYVQVSFIHP